MGAELMYDWSGWMSLKHWQTVVMGLSLVSACSEAATTELPTTANAGTTASGPGPVSGTSGQVAAAAGSGSTTTPVAGSFSSGSAGTAAPVAGTSAAAAGTGAAGSGSAAAGTSGSDSAGTGGEGPVTETPTDCDYDNEEVALTENLVIPAGKTVHVCPGVTFKAATGKDLKVDVQGTLIVDGTEAAPVHFLGGGTPRSWYGIAIAQGGELKLTHAEVGGAAYGVFALAGSKYAIDHSEFNTSFKGGILQSDGTITNSRFVATTPPTIAITNEVGVDDPNGTLTIMDASPSVTNTSFDGSSAFTDMVRVGGNASPTFDHVYVHAAHCGFHTFGGNNTSPHITNSVFEGLSYGIMAYTTKPIIEDSVFKGNANDVGICDGATEDNTPVLKNNNYSSGSPSVDPSCFRINTVDASPAASANPTAGPSGL